MPVPRPGRYMAHAKPPAPRRLASRLQHIQPFHVMDLLARAQVLAQQGRSVIHLEVGEPDFETPEPVRQAGYHALARGLTKYTAATGLQQLKQAISRDYARRYQVDVDPQHIVITPGASGALLLVFAALLESGDKVLLTDPGYPCNRHFATLFDAQTVAVPLDPASHYRLTPAHLERYWDDAVRVVLLASPANPTGAVMSADDIAAVHAFCQQHDAVLVMDEIYQGLVYDQPASTALSLSPEIIVINSFSKYFCMTGWRIGWMVIPEFLHAAVDRLAQNMFLAPPSLSQYAALAAFDDKTLAVLAQHREVFQQRIEFLYPQLQRLGFRLGAKPAGAFYLYADCSALTDDSEAFVLDLLDKTGVVITPGKDFGRHRSAQHVRFACTVGLDELQQAVDRLEAYLS